MFQFLHDITSSALSGGYAKSVSDLLSAHHESMEKSLPADNVVPDNNCIELTYPQGTHMSIKWPFARPPTATLAAIYICPAAGQPLQTVASIDAISDVGLQGDRYATQSGFWQATDACQITLISVQDLRRASKRASRELQAKLASGHHRRNLVIQGLPANALQGKCVRIGTAQFCYHKPRPPCGYLDHIEGDGLARALGKHSGICLRVVTSGRLHVGDIIEILN
jgi:MOSC domain